MKKLFSPKFSLLFVTLPQALLAAALFYAYTRAALSPSLPLMIIFGAQALLNCFVILCAAMDNNLPFIGKHLRAVQLAGFIAVMSAAAPFLLEQFDFASSLSPEAVYGALCLVPLIYIATSILHHNEIPLMKVKTRILLCVCVPLVFAVIPLLGLGGLFDSVLFGWARGVDWPHSWPHSLASVLFILLFALFFVFVCLATSILYHYRTRKNNGDEAHETRAVNERSPGYIAFIAVVALVLPLLCLFLNEAFGGIVGDFSGMWFYILASVNGIAMLIPRKNKWVTLAALFFKSAGFLYVSYFAVTMVRFAPLGVAFYAYLVPLLVLTPIALFAAELFQVIDDFRYLRQHFPLQRIVAVLACGMLALCAGFGANGYVHKVNLDNALCYLNEDVPEYPPVNIPMLKSSLRYMRYESTPLGREFGLNATQSLAGPPILSEIYHRLFFGGKTLGDDAYQHIKRIFLPRQASQWGHPPPEPNFLRAAETMESVKLSDVSTQARYDEAAGAYKAWVHLTLKNETDWELQEYAVKFTLPEGVFVTGYYLDVFGEIKHGIVAEKNVAKSVYASIVSRSRDPGIICYDSENTLELRVFPFGPHEARETGFELMFQQGDSFDIAGRTIQLEGGELTEPIATGGACFMPASYKANLEAVSDRTPKVYFVADTSQPPRWEEASTLEERLGRIRDYARNHEIEADVYLAGYNVRKTDLAQLEGLKYGEGGCNLALAMGMIYKDAQKHPGHYPVIIVATDNLYRAAVAENGRFPRGFPECEHYYVIDGAGALTPHHLSDNRMAETAAGDARARRLLYEGFYFRDDGKNELSFNNAAGFADISFGDNEYRNALLLHEKTEKAATNEQVVETVRDGISRRLLTKYNSFIVLETREQEEELERRNKEFLEGKTLGAASAPMSEPGLLAALLLTLLLLAALYMKRKHALRRHGTKKLYGGAKMW